MHTPPAYQAYVPQTTLAQHSAVFSHSQSLTSDQLTTEVTVYTDRDGAGALLARGRGTLIEGGVCGLSTLPALVACTHILETLVVSSVTPRTATLRSTPREDETARARPVSYFQPRFVFQQLEKRSWWPDEAGQLRFDSCWKKVQGVRHAPCVSGSGRGARRCREQGRTDFIPAANGPEGRETWEPGTHIPRPPRPTGAA